MSIADILGYGCWPLIALGGYLLFRDLRKPALPASDFTVWIVILSVGVPMFLIIFIFHDGSQILVFESKVFLILIGAAFLVPRRGAPPAAVVGATLVGVGLIGFGGWYLVGDFLLARTQVTGEVSNPRTWHSKAGYYYRVDLDGEPYYITGDLFETLGRGDRIEAQVGRASGTIFSVKALR